MNLQEQQPGGNEMEYKIYYRNEYVTSRASRDDALDFIAACHTAHRDDFEILDQSDQAAS